MLTQESTLTLVATARPIVAATAPPGPGLTPVVATRAPSTETADPEAVADLASWSDLHRSIQQGLCLGLILILSGLLGALLWCFDSVLPTFVTLFEGMSLKPPAPTRALIAVTKISRGVAFEVVWGLAKLICPTTLYLWLVGGGYGVPIVGRVWRHTDRLWQLYARRTHGEVPPEVAHRLSQALEQEFPQGSSLESTIRRERDRLTSTLWSLVPILALGMCLAVVAMHLFGMCLFLPLYQTVGNLG